MTARVVGCVLYEAEAEASLAQWVIEDVLKDGMASQLHDVLPCVVRNTVSNKDSFVTAACTSMQQYAQSHVTSHGVTCVFLVIAVFFDGQCEPSKAAFFELKELTEAKSARLAQLQKAIAQHLATDSTPPSTSSPVQMEVLVQALNAKKGEHTMRQNRAALVTSLQKRLATSVLLTKCGAAAGTLCTEAAGSSSSVTAGDAKKSGLAKAAAHDPAAAPATAPSIGAADISVPAIQTAVDEGQGECFLVISAEDHDRFSQRAAELMANCAAAEVGCAPVLPEPREVAVPSAAGSAPSSSTTGPNGAGGGGAGDGSAPKTLIACEYLLRRQRLGEHLELRLAMCGNVDSGKSTLTSVLTRGCRDDGRGSARAFVFNHKHEAATGRTSSISENHLGFSGTGEVVNYQITGVAAFASTGGVERTEKKPSAGSHAATGGSGGGGPAMVRPFTPQELASRSAKVFTLYDLAGHEKYLKTTVLGMTRNMPDYACIVISANNGIQRMTKEHLALCLALKLPFFVVITRIDATPENVHQETVSNVHKLLKIPTVRKLPYPVRQPGEVVQAAKNLRHDRITPIFEVSNVTGEGVGPLLRFLNMLPMRKDWRVARSLPKQMIIDSTFFVTGVGTVVGGIITQGVFHVNDTVLLGPDGFGHYRPVSIKSIHIKGVDSQSAAAGSDAAFCLKKEKRSAIRKGNVLVDSAEPPQSFWQFEAEVTILYHSTTISINYEPVIHSTTVRQSARITYVAQEVLRTGDRSLVRFHFLYRPEFMHEGQRLIFREGRTKGIGVVTKLVADGDKTLLAKHKVKKLYQGAKPGAAD